MIAPGGIKQAPFTAKGGKAKLTLRDLEACQLIVLANDAASETAYRDLFNKILDDEQQVF